MPPGFKRLSRVLGITTMRAIAREVYYAQLITANTGSFIRLASDVLLFRVLRVGGSPIQDRERTIHLRNGTVLTYRLNRGDIQGIREVWFDETYRLPFDIEVGRVIDLGANIGLTSVYFAKKYGVGTIIAVEPNPANALLAKRNLEQNGIAFHLVEAAIGPSDGVAYFMDAAESNLGYVSNQGREVRMISMRTLCSEFNLDGVDLLKIDIEGGEQALLTNQTGWINKVGAIIAEFHPDRVPYPALAEQVADQGFQWIKPGSVYRYTTDAFIRREATLSSPMKS